MTQITVLGCSGGIGGPRRTTCLKIGSHTLIDAGSGAMDLSLSEMQAIERVFITHSHLDHVMSIALLADAVGHLRSRPLDVFALPETIEVLQHNLFNNRLWPDFTCIPSAAQPYVRFHAVRMGDVMEAAPEGGTSASVLAGEHCRIEVLPARHSVPAVGYCVHGKQGAVAFSGDTGACPEFWARLNDISNLKAVLVETSFQNAEAELAIESGHFTPQTLLKSLEQFRSDCDVYISHLKPGEEGEIMAEFGSAAGARNLARLRQGQVWSL